MLLNCGVRENSWEFLKLQGDQTSQPSRKSVLNIHWKDWCWSWNCNILATSCEELAHWKRSWCWERLKAGRERDNRGWDGWMALSIQWTWVWVNSRSWWWTGRPGVLHSRQSQRVGQDWVTEWNWTECITEVKVKVGQLCLTLCDPVNYTVPGILQARILEWVAFPFSRASSLPRDRTQVSKIAGGFFTSWATKEAIMYSRNYKFQLLTTLA